MIGQLPLTAPSTQYRTISTAESGGSDDSAAVFNAVEEDNYCLMRGFRGFITARLSRRRRSLQRFTYMLYFKYSKPLEFCRELRDNSNKPRCLCIGCWSTE
jgi:hypothetical protein